MAIFRDLNTLLGLIGDGRAIRKINEDVPELMKGLALAAADEPRKKHKASVTLDIGFIAENGIVRACLEVKYKAPKKPPEESIFWLTKDGHWSDEHPKQINMFDRENARTIEGGKAIEGEAVKTGSTA